MNNITTQQANYLWITKTDRPYKILSKKIVLSFSVLDRHSVCSSKDLQMYLLV